MLAFLQAAIVAFGDCLSFQKQLKIAQSMVTRGAAVNLMRRARALFRAWTDVLIKKFEHRKTFKMETGNGEESESKGRGRADSLCKHRRTHACSP
jgi:hypothetical protein